MIARDEPKRREATIRSLARRLRSRTLPDLSEIGRLALIMLYADTRLGMIPHDLNRAWLHRKAVDVRTPGARVRAEIDRLVSLSRSAIPSSSRQFLPGSRPRAKPRGLMARREG